MSLENAGLGVLLRSYGN